MALIMLSSNLRNRCYWQIVSKQLDSVGKVKFQEIQNSSFDLALGDQCHHYQRSFLLLEVDKLDKEFERMTSWLKTPEHTPRTIMLIAGNDNMQSTQALQDVQLRIIESGDSVSVLPIPSLHKFHEILRAYVNGVPENFSSSNATPKSSAVIAWATSLAPHKPLTTQEVDTIRQICGSIEGLEKATRTPDGQKQLYQHLDPNIVDGIIMFWEDEWIA